jgi:hypothetical protein
MGRIYADRYATSSGGVWRNNKHLRRSTRIYIIKAHQDFVQHSAQQEDIYIIFFKCTMYVDELISLIDASIGVKKMRRRSFVNW